MPGMLLRVGPVVVATDCLPARLTACLPHWITVCLSACLAGAQGLIDVSELEDDSDDPSAALSSYAQRTGELVKLRVRRARCARSAVTASARVHARCEASTKRTRMHSCTLHAQVRTLEQSVCVAFTRSCTGLRMLTRAAPVSAGPLRHGEHCREQGRRSGRAPHQHHPPLRAPVHR
jgi:hypothetical protein